MKRFISSKDLYVGQLVVTGDDVGTAVRTIAEIDHVGCTVILQWMEGNRFCSKGYASFILKQPDLEQIEWHLANGGPLLSVKQIIDWA